MADPTTVAALGEDGLIRLFTGSDGSERSAVDQRLVLDNGDDAAAWKFDETASVATTDSLVEGQHFDLSYTPPADVGRKLMAVNLSDLAAMGAIPRYALLSVCLPGSMQVSTVRELCTGIHEQCRRHSVRVVGGNTTGIRGPSVLTVTLIGEASPDALALRTGARPGAAIFVTGSLGDAAAGLRLALGGRVPPVGDPAHALFKALTDPMPRVAAGVALARTGRVISMCDVSDGLGRDLRRLLAFDGLGARIETRRLPLSSALRAAARDLGAQPEMIAMAGGEDYELLLIAEPEHHEVIRAACASSGTPVTRIGTVTNDGAVRAIDHEGGVLDVPTGFEHYEAPQRSGDAP